MDTTTQNELDIIGTDEQTNQYAKAMLTYAVGHSILDSGGIYGRQYQRNQTRDFDAEPPYMVKFETWESEKYGMRLDVVGTVSLYHYLRKWLTYSPKYDAMFHAFCELPENEHTNWLELMETFADSIGVECETINTYNGESMLDQVMQYVYFTCPDTDEQIVLVSVHGGCDVRGGYAKPHAFVNQNTMEYGTDGFHYAHADNVRFSVEGEDGYPDDADSLYELSGIDKDTPVTTNPELKGKGYLYLAEDGTLYHPNGNEIHTELYSMDIW